MQRATAAALADVGARAPLVRRSNGRAVGPADDPAVDRADVASEQGADSRADGDADVNADDAAVVRADASPDDGAHRGADQCTNQISRRCSAHG